jgi:hypothetical protein
MRLLPALALSLFLSAHAMADDVALISRLAPDLKPVVISEAVSAMKCAQHNGVGTSANRLAIIDYTLPSHTPRLWVLDLQKRKLLFEELVAHGKGSGEDVPNAFSDLEGSHQSSLGLYLTDETYEGGNGYSLKLQGLSRGFNESAMQRAIVMHGAAYVNPEVVSALGRLGRSWGCPAVRTAVARPIIDTLKLGQFIYAYGPGTAKLASCKSENLAFASHSSSGATSTDAS